MRAFKWKCIGLCGFVGRRRMSGTAMERTYSDAVSALNTLQSNAATIAAIRAAGPGANMKAIPEMIEWSKKAGYDPEEYAPLNAIHIAGTKGKGSTSAFISSILTQYLHHDGSTTGSPKKVGLYTSPHLRFVRERIRINNEPISEALFVKHFFTIWDRLEAAAKREPQSDGGLIRPVYFRYLTLMAFHAYLTEGVDTAVIECGMGGEYDSTNILTAPTVTGITSLGIDHTAMLGNTIEEIAWHKAGIMKKGVVCFTAPQPDGAMKVLRDRAVEIGADLRVVDRHPEIESGEAALGLNADFQKMNASVAVEIAAEHLRKLGFKDLRTNPLPAEFKKGLATVQWGGRCEVRQEKDLTWYIDGAHTRESIEVAGKWFVECVQAPSTALSTTRILLFNQQTRAGIPLLYSLHSLLAESLDQKPFSHVIFCSNETFKEAGYRPDLMSVKTTTEEIEDLKVQKELAAGWGSIEDAQRSFEKAEVVVVRTIEEGIMKAREIAASELAKQNGSGFRKIKVLATGSVHLVGGVIEVLETEKEKMS